MALSTKTLDALNDSRKTEPHKYIWGQFTPDKEGVGYSDLPEQTNIPDDANLVLDVNGPSLVKASVKDLKNGIGRVDIATTEKAGIVKPDGTTISVSSEGTISSSSTAKKLMANCILSSPNGVLDYTIPLNEQISIGDGTGVVENVLTNGNAMLVPPIYFNRDNEWFVKLTFKITSGYSFSLLSLYSNTAYKDGCKYLDLFGTIYKNNTLSFYFLRGYNDRSLYPSTSPGFTRTIELNTEYTAIYSSLGKYSLYQGDTKIIDFVDESKAFKTLFQEAYNKNLGTLYWSTYSGKANINFNGTSFTFNNGKYSIPNVQDGITLKNGVRLLLPNGRNPDGTFNNIEKTVLNDITVKLGGELYSDLYYIFTDGSTLLCVGEESFYFVNDIPIYNTPASSDRYYYIPSENKLYVVKKDTTILIETPMSQVGYFICKDRKFYRCYSFSPVQLNLSGIGDYVIKYAAFDDGSWYRLYKSGWVEQGGYFKHPDGSGTGTAAIVLPVKMASSNYQVIRTVDKGGKENDSGSRWVVGINGNKRTTTSFTFFYDQVAYAIGDFWEVKGMSAG